MPDTYKGRLFDHPLYSRWQGMKQRCLNPNNAAYHRYGGRGITMHPAWVADFLTFVKDMGMPPTPSHDIDRKKNDKGYEPGNCRWVTKTVNHRNRSDSRLVEFRGETKHLMDWCCELGLNHDAVRSRLRKGWTVEQALTSTPPIRLPKKVTRRVRSNAITMTYKGVTKHVIDWCEELGLNYQLVTARLKRGWPPEEVVARPPDRSSRIHK